MRISPPAALMRAVTPGPVQVATEGALWGAIRHRGLMPKTTQAPCFAQEAAKLRAAIVGRPRLTTRRPALAAASALLTRPCHPWCTLHA
jgi:hypothetical protein